MAGVRRAAAATLPCRPRFVEPRFGASKLGGGAQNLRSRAGHSPATSLRAVLPLTRHIKRSVSSSIRFRCASMRSISRDGSPDAAE